MLSLIGAPAGLAIAVALGWAVYRGSHRLPLGTFFAVTNVVLVGFGVYLVWMGVGELGEAIGGGLRSHCLRRAWRSRRGTGRPNEVPAAGKAA